MTEEEIERYYTMEPPPVGGPYGTHEWAERQKWFYARIRRGMEATERGEVYFDMPGVDQEEARRTSLASSRHTLAIIEERLLEYSGTISK
jgi:hypothetical protein